jgi:Immunity protein 42
LTISLFALPAELLRQRLRDALYGPNNNEYEAQATREQWARFDVRVPVDVLDGCTVFLVENPPVARIVFTTDHDRPVQEATVKAGEVDDVLMRTHKELNDLHEQALKHAGHQHRQ